MACYGPGMKKAPRRAPFWWRGQGRTERTAIRFRCGDPSLAKGYSKPESLKASLRPRWPQAFARASLVRIPERGRGMSGSTSSGRGPNLKGDPEGPRLRIHCWRATVP